MLEQVIKISKNRDKATKGGNNSKNSLYCQVQENNVDTFIKAFKHKAAWEPFFTLICYHYYAMLFLFLILDRF